MPTIAAPGTTPEERIAHWRSLGWEHLRTMMESTPTGGPAPVARLTGAETRVRVTPQ
ncbi:hypothetical protein [Cellulomonas sp. Y8]|uniref:hypothetical protein n=1 Tax=Cellulomonas sp. Y8 TaxID=2591145 RepID=UPI00143DB304|nr:hypothetical protein [Cellulomonas sp. Y8]